MSNDKDFDRDIDNHQTNVGRRNFIKGAAIAATAVGTTASTLTQTAAAQSSSSAMPMKTLGSTGIKVPILHMGTAGDMDPTYDKIMHYSYREGITMFDTALQYGSGASHVAVGNFIKQVGDRENLWITSKSHANSVNAYRNEIDECLEALEVDYLDAYFMHGLRDEKKLDADYMKVAEDLRKSGKTKFTGFSCHNGNVVELMNKAAKVGGVDVILFRYNFRQYGDMELNKAIDACHAAGIGLMAMKTQGSVPGSLESVVSFQSENFSLGQAKLKSVWADERITSAVSEMASTQQARENIAAAKSTVSLSATETHQLNRLSALTAHHHCMGCDNICESASDNKIAIADPMRYMMYYESYGKQQRAKELYSEVPVSLKGFDQDLLAKASAACPQRIDIPARLEKAHRLLA